MSDMPRLEVGRFLLTIPSAAAAGRVVELLRENWGRFAPVMPEPDEGFFTEEHWAARLTAARDELAAGTALHLVLFEGDEAGPVVGQISYTQISRGAFQACYLGYKLAERLEGQGVMSAALRRANGYVFEDLGLHRIMANYVPTNERSGRLLRRLGFVVEGYARDYLCLAGEWQDHVLTALVRAE